MCSSLELLKSDSFSYGIYIFHQKASLGAALKAVCLGSCGIRLSLDWDTSAVYGHSDSVGVNLVSCQ